MSRFIGNVSAYAYAVEQGYTGTEEEFATLMASYATVAEEAAESASSAGASATSASASAGTASTKASEASASATQADTKASQASASATQASASATSASQSASTATTKASEASASASTASTKASEASASASTASSKASEASQSASDANTAKTGAQTAQGLAESAKDDAESARDLAQQYAESIDPDNIFSAYPTDTASGSVATFADGADDIPVKSCVVAIEPVQDLHGYDHPWPAGGGKNKFDGYTANWKKWQLNSNVFTTRPDTYTAITFTPNEDGTVTAVTAGTYMGIAVEIESSDADRVFSVSGASYVGLFSAYEDGASRLNISPTYVTISAGVSGCIAIRFDAAGTYTIKCQLESGSTATAYAPYSNICPISGFTEANVVRTGKNLFSYDPAKATTGTTTVGATRAYYPLEVSNCTLSFSAELIDSGSVTTSNINIGMLKDGILSVLNGFISPDGIAERTFTFSENEQAVLMTADSSVTSIITNFSKYRICVTTGSTPTAYEPYTDDTYSITFPSEAGTVYGGTLDVTSGVLTVDRGIIASYNGETLPAEWISDRDKYVAGTTPTTGAQVCYELATPVTYNLTPTEIKSLLGDNNVWADAGDTAVTYRADTKLYIDKKIAEVINALS